MDTYLAIAQEVLQRCRRPMTPRDMLREAYREDLVPTRLHGKTQHKTLQARLSIDILRHRDRSLFFRTAPGRFFLREFLSDPTVPEEFRQQIVARRRERDLRRKEVLTLPASSLPATAGFTPDRNTLSEALAKGGFSYQNLAHGAQAEGLSVWSFVVVQRNSEILTYRLGRYREGRDSFLQKRCVGFYAAIVRSDINLFDQQNHGVIAAGVHNLLLDLDTFDDPDWHEVTESAKLEGFLIHLNDLVGVVRVQCPAWFEPNIRRLAINDLVWHDLSCPLNHVEDFDPWSQEILERAQYWLGGHSTQDGKASTRSN